MGMVAPHFEGRRSRKGFSLIEILTVMLIIGVLAVIGLVGVNSINKGNSVKGAVSTVSSLALAARNEAMTKGLGSRLIIDADLDHPQRYLRRFTVLEATDPDDWDNPNIPEWTYSTKPTLLPEGVYFSEDYSSGYGTMQFDFKNTLTGQAGSSGDDVFYYEFNGNGRLVDVAGANDLATIVFMAGIQQPGDGTWSSPGDMEFSMDGFIIRRLGRLTFFDNPTEQIKELQPQP